MWLIIFMAGCIVPLLITACVYLWRDYQWNKYNESTDSGENV